MKTSASPVSIERKNPRVLSKANRYLNKTGIWNGRTIQGPTAWAAREALKTAGLGGRSGGTASDDGKNG